MSCREESWASHPALASPALVALDQEFVPDLPELLLNTGFVFPCLAVMLGVTLPAWAALTGAHSNHPLETPFYFLLVKYCAKGEFSRVREFLKDERGAVGTE